MTLDDARNMEMRLRRQGDADAAEFVRVLVAALMIAAEEAEVTPEVFLNEADWRPA